MILLFFIFGGAMGFLFGILWEIATIRIAHWACQKGYHFHHSLFGPLMLLFLPWLQGSLGPSLFLVGAAAGVVLQHTINEGFIFITIESHRCTTPAARKGCID